MAGGKTVQAFSRCVNNLHQFELIVPYLKKLGQDHFKMNVRKRYLELFESVFLKTVEQSLKDEYTPEVKKAYIKFYSMLKKYMIGD